jgi:ferrochelatase
MNNEAILITNLGSPAAPDESSLKSYLKEFLMDPYVIDVPFPLRWFLVNVLIVPKRAHLSAEAYSNIWFKEGSPLKVYTKNLAEKLKQAMPKHKIFWAMRYGEPSLESALTEIHQNKIKKIFVLPLYPQYALATSRSTEVQINKINKIKKLNLNFDYYPYFYNEEFYLSSATEVYNNFLSSQPKFDHYLFSYHGLPERHVRKTDPSKNHCLKTVNCCETFNSNNQYCYRRHCWVNTQEIAKRLNIHPSQFSMCFQSRLGRDEWLKPETESELRKLAQAGVKRVAVFSPAFVADCLETLEEIAMRAKEVFMKSGGENLELVPSLNDNNVWVKNLANFLEKKVQANTP